MFATPRPGQTWLEHNLSGEAWKAEVLSVPLAAVRLGIDIVLLVIPVAAVVGLQLTTKRKIGVMMKEPRAVRPWIDLSRTAPFKEAMSFGFALPLAFLDLGA